MSNKSPDISVIIPVKNRAHYIGSTIDSLLNQTLQPKEIIVVNDHSSDNLEEALLPYTGKIILINSENRGPGAARNAGLNIATGNYIQFFDSDDIMSPNKLEVQAILLLENNADVAYGPFVKAREIETNASTEQTNQFQFSAINWKQEDVIMQYFPLANENKLLEYVARGWCPITQSCLFTRRIIEKTNGWNETVFTHEDLDFWFQVAFNKPKIIHSNHCMVIYRQHNLQLTNEKEREIQYTKNHLSVLSQWEGITLRKVRWKSKVYLQARKLQSELFLQKADNINRSTKKWQLFNLFLFRIFNKYERWKTGSLWERMHGPSSKPFFNNNF